MNADKTVIRISVHDIFFLQVKGLRIRPEFQLFFLAVFNGEENFHHFGQLVWLYGLVQKITVIRQIQLRRR